MLCLLGMLLSALNPVCAHQDNRQTTIVGEVHDQTGAMIVGAEVTLLSRSGDRLASGVTDGSGRFSLVATALPGYRVQVYKYLFYPKAVDVARSAMGAQALVITLEVSGVKMEDGVFSDSPDFKAAGITDWSNIGLHGSDTTVKTGDVLAKDAAALKPPNANKSPTSANEISEADKHRLLADAKEKSGDPVAAEHEYAIATKLSGSEENYFSWGAELLLHRAGAAAIDVFEKGTVAYPFSERMRAALGAAYYENGQFSEAAEAMCHASDVNPSDPAPYLFLGRIEQSARDIFPCSEERLRRFSEQYRKPEQPEANFYYGLVLVKKARQSQKEEDFASAELAFRKALSGHPLYGEVCIQLGLLYNARGKREAALVEFQNAVGAAPRLAEAHYQLSLAYRRAGETAKADQEIKKYEDLHRSEEAALEKERKEMKQFVTVLQQSSPKR